MSQFMNLISPGQFLPVNPLSQTCPSSTTTPSGCASNPNSIWVPSNSSLLGTSQGQCVCCSTDGTSYVNKSATSTADACKSCGTNAKCGDGNGYCAEPGNPNCVQDPTTKKWFIRCPSNSCNGSCGVGEWIAFQSCIFTNGCATCQFDIGQWKSWLFYGLVFLCIIIIAIIIGFAVRRRRRIVIENKTTSTLAPELPAGSMVDPTVRIPV